MTTNSVANSHPTPQATNTPACELSWDDVVDGTFPPIRQQRMQQAAVAAAEQLHEQPDVQLTQDRLTKALDLVLSNAVVLYQDNTASVRSGSHRYTVANGGCSCADAKHRGRPCKHMLAVEIHRRATALVQDVPVSAASEPAPAVAGEAAAASARWDVHEAPTSACFKFRVQTMELTYTFRGVDDAELQARIAATLPMLQTMMEGCEDRSAARRNARDAATAAPQEQTPPVGSSVDLLLLVQQAVQQALTAQASGQAAANSRPPAEPPPAPPPQEPPADLPEGYCALHQVGMEQRSNARGSWYSHIATDEEGEYFCKGTGRSRRNGR